jgi:long-chain acyl-CoA synthetase
MRKASLKNVTIIELLVAINRRFSNIPAVQAKRADGFYSISYIDLGRRTADTSYTLKTLGVEKGDRVAILSESRPEWSIAFFGIVSCAGVTVPMDAKLSDAEIEFILNDSEAKCLFTSAHYIERIQALRPKLKFLKQIILFDEAQAEGLMLLKDCKVPEGEVSHREITPEDIALTVYTSGTTGVAKGVQLTYKNLLFEVMSLNDYVEFKPGDQFLSILPLNHMLELTGGLIAPLYVGGTITYCDSIKPTNILKLMNETKTTTMICVPLVLKMFHDSIIKKAEGLPGFKKNLFFGMMNLSKFLLRFKISIGRSLFGAVHKQFGGHLRCFVSGGAPLDPIVEENFSAMGFNVLQGYGLTETSPVITVNTFKERKYGSVGIPLKGLEVKILPNSETGKKEGEIITRGPQVMLGYYRNPEKTAEVIKDGWFYTGDIGYFDKDGFLFISGRIKNMIVLGAGKKVFPEEIEEVMSASPFIKEICVLGRVADKGARKGCEEVYAVVVANVDHFAKEERDNKELVKKKIGEELSRLGENLAEYKKIMNFDLWYDELPKTSTRKIKRKVLLEMISKKDTDSGAQKQEFIESAPAVEDELTVKLKQLIADLIKMPIEQVKISSNLYNDLGVDSLMKVELLSSIEKQFGVHIPDEAAYELTTLSDVVRFLKEYKSGRKDDESVTENDMIRIIKDNVWLRMTRTVTYFGLRTFMRTYLKLKVEGSENIPADGSFIIGANHTSLLDFPIIFSSLSYARTRKVIAPAAQDFFYASPVRRVLTELAFNTFPFERMGNFVKGLKICSQLIKTGKTVILFPEGSRSVKGELGKFKPGIGSLAFDLDIPIVPCRIQGAFEVLPKGKVIPRSRKVTITFGKPITMAPYKALATTMPKYQIYERVAEDLRGQVHRLGLVDKNG